MTEFKLVLLFLTVPEAAGLFSFLSLCPQLMAWVQSLTQSSWRLCCLLRIDVTRKLAEFGDCQWP